MTSPTLDRVLQGQLCSGCGLCASIGGDAIAMTLAAPGYLRPRQSAEIDADQEAAIADACPGARVAAWPGNAHPYWGPGLRVATGHAADPALRFAASSGGLVSAAAIQALDSGLVDAVLHVGADPDDPAGNCAIVSTTAGEIAAAAGSRYAPSAPLADVVALAGDGRRYAVIAKPCDISALARYRARDDAAARAFPLLLSFFCGGIPSRAGIDTLLGRMGLAGDSLAAFRYRGNGWPGRAMGKARDGAEASLSYAESWGLLSSTVQFRCKICPDAVGGAADLAFADAWRLDPQGAPSFAEAEGRSLVIARTPPGLELLAAAEAQGRVALAALPIAAIDAMQPAQARRKRLIVARLAALVVTGQQRPDYAGVKVAAAAGHAGVIEQAKNFLGLIRRVVRERK